MKEEEYQDGFLSDLFVKILGYTKRPNEGFDLIRKRRMKLIAKRLMEQSLGLTNL